MRWSASAPVTWPADTQWQAVWQEGLDELAATRVGADGTVEIEDAQPGDPRIVLVEGTHLQPGAGYRIAPELTTGVLRAWVGGGRAAGAEWAPHDEPGRAHVEVQTLDGLRGVRAESTLEHVQGRLRLALTEPADLLDAEVELAWVRATIRAEVRGGELRVDIRVRGLGMWWPTLAPIFLGARDTVQTELEKAVAETATSLTMLATTGVLEAPVRRESLAEIQHRHERDLRAGYSQIARRQRTVADTLDLLPWWRRTPARWRTELAAQPAPSWPATDALLWEETWVEAEEGVVATLLRQNRWRRSRELDRLVSELVEQKVEDRLAQDAQVEAMVNAPRVSTEPWLTDESTDLSWLATPWQIFKQAKNSGTS